MSVLEKNLREENERLRAENAKLKSTDMAVAMTEMGLRDEITRLRNRVMELTDALIDARHNGLIYWRPITERGVVEQTKMMSRIDAVIIKGAKP